MFTLDSVVHNRTKGQIISTSSDQLAGDNDALNMAGTLVDLQAFDITVVALHRVVIRIAAIAVQQQRCFYISSHISQCRLDHLEISNALTELATLCSK